MVGLACDGEVLEAVLVEVIHDNRMRSSRQRDGAVGRAGEAARSVSQQHGEVGADVVEDGEVLRAIAVEISDNRCERVRTQCRRRARTRSKTARTVAQQNGHSGRRGPARGGEVRNAIAVKVADHGTAWGGSEAADAVCEQHGYGVAEGAVGGLERVRHDNVRNAIAIEVSDGGGFGGRPQSYGGGQ